MNTASLNLTVVQIGSIVVICDILYVFLIFSYLEEPSTCIQVRIHFYLLYDGISAVFRPL